MATDLSDGSSNPVQLSLPLPGAHGVHINIHLTVQSTSIVLFLTTSASEAPASSCPLGSFVYAIPARNTSNLPLTTALYTVTPTLDLATRMAQLIARKTGKPTYVGNSMSFAAAGRGGDVEEEMAGFRRVVEVVMAEIEKSGAPKIVNGT